MLGGERAAPERAAQWLECAGSSVELHNEYGTTEAREGSVAAVAGSRIHLLAEAERAHIRPDFLDVCEALRLLFGGDFGPHRRERDGDAPALIQHAAVLGRGESFAVARALADRVGIPFEGRMTLEVIS